VTDKKVKTIDAKKAAEMEAANFDLAKQDLIFLIKTEAADRIAATDWKVERAKERDALNGVNNVHYIYADRELIQVASDEAETAVAGLESLEEITSFIL
jgi:hypothetical protein